MNIPDNYYVLFQQGGASLQFCMVHYNLFIEKSATYVITGYWSKKAVTEARKLGKVNIVAISDYNAFPLEGIQAPVEFMAEFKKANS